MHLWLKKRFSKWLRNLPYIRIKILLKLNIVRHVYKVIICLKKIKIDANNFQNGIIFYILIKCESKFFFYIYNIKLIEENICGPRIFHDASPLDGETRFLFIWWKIWFLE